jgi:Fe-Mn family superoxide dismutase
MNKLVLPPLPYSYDALEPVISKTIMELHHDKHHLAYVNAANAAQEKLEKSRQGETVNIRKALRDYSFNYNGAKLHEIFWENMRPYQENNLASEAVNQKLGQYFGSWEKFKNEFSQAAATVEGSGWAVLWQDETGNLTVGQLEKHNLLGLNGQKPVLVLDVWEHAYYLDYLNNRAQYIDKWWQVVNWEDVEKRIL